VYRPEKDEPTVYLPSQPLSSLLNYIPHFITPTTLCARERDKPFYAAATANRNLANTSPVLKILDALFVTAAKEILADGRHSFTADY
jgi:hypothetical protein